MSDDSVPRGCHLLDFRTKYRSTESKKLGNDSEGSQNFNLPCSAHKERYCGKVDIRATSKYGDVNTLYENCTVVEGNFILAVYNDSSTDDSIYELFQSIRVVTGFVVVFYTDNIRSLSRVLPNLRVIGGDEMIADYSLVVYGNTGLQDIGLSRLNAILNGGVYSASNQNLCYVRSIDWNRLLEGPDKHVFIDEGANLKADPCLYPSKCNPDNSSRCLAENGRSMCWSKTSCQKECRHDFDFVRMETTEELLSNRTERVRGPGCDDQGQRCHEQCIGGCSVVDDPRACHYCRNVVSNGTCMEKCPKGLIELRLPRKIRRCIFERECYTLSIEIFGNENDSDTLRIADNACQAGCPAGMEKGIEVVQILILLSIITIQLKIADAQQDANTYENDPYGCKNCTDLKACLKKCTDDFLLHDGSELKRLFHAECEVIDGSLEIELTDRVGFYMAEALNETLSRLREITGHLIIRFSTSLTSLKSFKNLEKIGGRSLYQNRFALAVFDNKNLVELFDTTNGKNLTIGRGSIQFQNNPQLCYKEIMELVKFTHLDNATVDASPFSNGDQAICDQVYLSVWTQNITYKSANIFWEPMDLNDTDHRKLLGYQIYFTEVPDNNSQINIYEGRSACDDKWKMKFHPNPNEDFEMGNLSFLNRGPLNETLYNLLPFKWYAVYVQTKVVKHNGSRQGFSRVEFFRTRPYKPSEPVGLQHKEGPDEIRLAWRSPILENGKVTHYTIEIQAEDDSYFTRSAHVCDSYGRRLTTVKPVSFRETEYSHINMYSSDDFFGGTCKKQSGCCKCNQFEERTKTFQDSVVSQQEIEQHEKRINLEAEMENKIQDHVFSLESENVGRVRRHLLYGAAVALKTIYGDCKIEKDYYDDLPICLVKNRTHIHRFNVTTLRAVIRGLTHYTFYRIQISACQNSLDDEVGYCSQKSANVTIRTMELPQNDVIEGIKVLSMNNSLEGSERSRNITWKQLQNPNGAVLGYEVRLTPVGNEKANAVSKCVNASEFRRRRGVVFHKLAEGTYEVAVQPITTAVVNGSVLDNVSKMKKMLIIKEPFMTWAAAMKYLLVCSLLLIIVAVAVSLVSNKAARKIVLGKETLYSVGFIDEDDDEYKPDEWDIERDKIEFVKKIGAGRFGEVFYARPLPDSGYAFTECAVKRSPLTDDALSRKHFIAEGQLMKNFTSHFIVKLYGISAEKGEPALIFLEFMEKGNLRDLLREKRACHERQLLEHNRKHIKKSKRNREGVDGSIDNDRDCIDDLDPRKPYNVGYGNSVVKMEQCFLWSAQIADAMSYLEAHQFVHRDLAARNVLVDGQENVKLGDFGLTRDVYYHEYYRPSGARPLPVRWMSPETMRDGIFTSKSDVWSYGIVLYEIFTLGERPYPHVDNESVFEYVEKRNLNKKPLGCPSFWYDLMLDCWHFQPNSRLSFVQIVTKLLPYVGDPEFIKKSFTCNLAKDVTDTEKIEIYDKDISSETTQMEFVKKKVMEQQKTDDLAVKKEFRKNGNIVREQEQSAFQI